MAEESPNIVLLKLDKICRGRQTLTAKVGTVATSMVSMMKLLDEIDGRMSVFAQRQQEQTNTIRLVVIAVDGHTHWLDKTDKTALSGSRTTWLDPRMTSCARRQAHAISAGARKTRPALKPALPPPAQNRSRPTRSRKLPLTD
jgi:hypothetical protein